LHRLGEAGEHVGRLPDEVRDADDPGRDPLRRREEALVELDRGELDRDPDLTKGPAFALVIGYWRVFRPIGLGP
jgi:hypothetical protein